MTSRRPLSDMRRLKLFQDKRGVCHLCEQKIQVGQKWEVEHVIPLALGGADDETNMAPAHKSCHGEKSKVDAGNLAKANRRRAKHLGASKPRGFPKPPEGYRYDWKLGRHVKEAR